MNKLLIIVSIILCCGQLSSAQSYHKIHDCDNAVKLSLGSLALSNVHLKYERKLPSKFSFQISLGKYLPIDLVKRLSDRNFSWREYDVNLENFNELEFYGNYLTIPEINLSGFYTQGEIRWYPGKKDALRGFYLAPFYTFHMAALNNVEAYDSEGYFYNGNVSVQYAGGGLQTGIQWLVKRWLIIDFHFLGFGAARVKNKVSYSTDNPYVNYESQVIDFENFVLDELKLEQKKYDITVSENQLNYELKLTAPVLRSGVSIGVVF